MKGRFAEGNRTWRRWGVKGRTVDGRLGGVCATGSMAARGRDGRRRAPRAPFLAHRVQNVRPSTSARTAGFSLPPHASHTKQALCHTPVEDSALSAAYTVSPHRLQSAIARYVRACAFARFACMCVRA